MDGYHLWEFRNCELFFLLDGSDIACHGDEYNLEIYTMYRTQHMSMLPWIETEEKVGRIYIENYFLSSFLSDHVGGD